MKCVFLILSLFFPVTLYSAQEDNAKFIFQEKCSLCHGEFGKGDGRLAVLITNPPPANFTKSRLSYEQIRLMIRDGGEVNGRSSSMPAWEAELTPKNISQLAQYVFFLRDEE
jgi:cytochrome c oxidase cbb3-type subunit 3